MKNINPLVSVIIPCFNHEKFIEARIKSIIQQTYNNIEIILIDDNSSDSSPKIIKQYEKMNNVFAIYNKNSVGPFYAHNLGVNYSNGDYLLFAESDDISNPQLIELLLNTKFFDSNIAVSYSKSAIINENDKIIAEDFHHREKKFRKLYLHSGVIPREKAREFLLVGNIIPNMSAALIKKSVFQNAGGLDTKYRLCADWDLWMKISLNHDFYYVNKSLNYFRIHQSTVRFKFKYREIYETYSIIIEQYNKQKLGFIRRQKIKNNIAYNWVSYVLFHPIISFKTSKNLINKVLFFDPLFFIRFIGVGLVKIFKVPIK